MTSSTLSSQQEHAKTPSKSNVTKVVKGIKAERIEFRATGDLLKLLNTLKDESGISMSESIRRGVALFSIAKKEAERGSKLVFMQNGEIVGEVENI